MGHALGARTIMLATRDLLSLSDDELQLVHEAIPGHALWCCVLCCKRLRIAALASGGLAHAAAVAGDLASMKRAHLRGCPLSRAAWAGTLCHIAAARNDLTMLRWALANGGAGPHGSVVMELAIDVGNLEMARAIHERGCVYDIGRAYKTAAIRGHLAIVQWLYARDVEYVRAKSHAETFSLRLLRQTDVTKHMSLAAERSARNGHLELLKWLIVHHVCRRNAIWSKSMRRCILSAAARGGHLHIIEWAHSTGHPDGEPGEEWTTATNVARAAAESVQRGRYETLVLAKTSLSAIEACRLERLEAALEQAQARRRKSQARIADFDPATHSDTELAEWTRAANLAKVEVLRVYTEAHWMAVRIRDNLPLDGSVPLRMAAANLPREMSVHDTHFMHNLHTHRYGASGWPTPDG